MRHNSPKEIKHFVPLEEHMVQLAGLGTAKAPYELRQDLVKIQAQRILGSRYPSFQRLAKTFETSGVETRYSVCPHEWFEETQDWPSRTRHYLEGASQMFVKAANTALSNADWRADEIDTIVTVSSTGIATPTLEARVFTEMGFRTNVHRVPLFGLGCAGGVSGLATARRLAVAEPGSKVLLVCVETCTLNFRDDRMQKADIIATVLFGDGAAAVCLTSCPTIAQSEGTQQDKPILGDGVEHLWPDTLQIMGWDVDPNGFGVIFDRSIPPFVEENFADAANGALEQMGFELDELSRLVCHPGGMKVLDAIEGTLNLEPQSLDHERTVLQEYGNMSAPTVLFVLEKVMANRPQGQMVMAALGPGFTASFLPIAFPS